MDSNFRLSAAERKRCLAIYRSDRRVRRVLILLLLCEGASYRQLQRSLLVSPWLVAEVKRDYANGGIAGVLGQQTARVRLLWWIMEVVHWLMQNTPRDFGFFRSRWSCALLALLLNERHQVHVSPETIRRKLHQAGFVWRRPRPVVGPRDPEYDLKIRRIRRFLRQLPADKTAVFQDEVDIHLNPKIGSCWMRRGQQALVVTPGNNEKAHVAGSIHWRTGTLLLSAPGKRRDAALFVAHLDDLSRRLRSYRMIHVICDNAKFHTCRAVQECLTRHRGRLQLHFLPKYAPQTNPIERVWWHLHETITRNHRCQTLQELINEVFDWVQKNNCFYSQTAYFRDKYNQAA